MKKLSLVIALILSIGVFAACSQAPAPSSGAASADKKIEGDLATIIETLYEGIPSDKMVGTMQTPVTEEMSTSFTGVEFNRYKEAVASDAAINAQAHSVVLIRANSIDEAEQLKKDIEEKADPRKWICVEAEKKIVDRVGDTIILIMTYEDIADQVHQNFLALAK